MKPPAGQYFRAGAGAVIVNSAGHVLALERAGISGAWQLPQGGLEADEEPFDAALREAREETGIPPDDLKLLGRYPDLLAYELPAAQRKPKTGRGQVHYWFVFRYVGSGDIQLPQGGEFKNLQWMPLPQLAARTIAFRRPVYEKLARFLEQLIQPARPRS